MSIRHDLIRTLADGRVHSGSSLGDVLGVTRAAIHKAIHQWIKAGVAIQSEAGRGYRLKSPFVPLDVAVIESDLLVRGVRIPVDIVAATESTNAVLMTADDSKPRVCLAEMQSAGRGRRGRAWLSTPYRNLLMSVRWGFEAGSHAVSGLSLVAGVAVSRALEDFGVAGVGLKWPKDVMLEGRKLGGILVELRGEAGGPVKAVIGLGLNIELSPADAGKIDQPWIDLRQVVPAPIDRNRLAAAVVAELVGALDRFERDGFPVFQGEWERRHIYRNRDVSIRGPNIQLDGQAVGIDHLGSLQVRDSLGEIHACHSGEVSLREGHR